MPTITGFANVDGLYRYLVDGSFQPGIVKEAVQYLQGIEQRLWLRDGLLDRVDGPALVEPDTPYRVWCLRGVLNRYDGPALIERDGTRRYMLGGCEFFWAVPEALWSVPFVRGSLFRAVLPRTPRGVVWQTSQQRRKALRVLSEHRDRVSDSVLQATIEEAIAAADPDVRRWGQSLLSIVRPGTRAAS